MLVKRHAKMKIGIGSENDGWSAQLSKAQRPVVSIAGAVYVDLVA
jgi:hypothetical protein